MKLSDRWNQFWYAEASRQSLCLFRIFFGFAFLMKTMGLSNLQFIAELDAEFPNYKFDDASNYYLAGFRLPVPGFEWLPAPSLFQHQVLDYVLFVAAILMVVGFGTRLATGTIALIWTYEFLLSQFTYRHHVMMILVCMLILAASRCDEHYSLSAYLRGERNVRPRSILPIRLLQVFTTIIYTFSFLGKLNPGWFTGDIMLIFRDQHSIDGDLRTLLDTVFALGHVAAWEETFYRSLAWFTLFAEGLLAFGLWVPKLRRLTIAVGVLLHLGIDLTMNVNTFSFQMYTLYICFINPASRQTICIYDGRLQVSDKLMRYGRLLDWLVRIRWVDIQRVPELVAGEANTGRDTFRWFLVQDSRGAWRRDWSGVIHLLSLFPLTFLVALPLSLLAGANSGTKEKSPRPTRSASSSTTRSRGLPGSA